MVDAIKLANLNDNLRRPLQKVYIGIIVHTYEASTIEIALLPCQAFLSRFKIEPSSYFYSICHITSPVPSILQIWYTFHVPIFIRQLYNTSNVFLNVHPRIWTTTTIQKHSVRRKYFMVNVQHSTILICTCMLLGFRTECVSRMWREANNIHIILLSFSQKVILVVYSSCIII